MVKFSFEVPLHHLKDFEEDQDFLFTLSILYQYKEYREYVRNSNLELWIDNSYNETQEADSRETLRRLYEEYNPRYVIAPDSPHWPVEQLRTEFLRTAERIPRDRLILVIPDYRHYQVLRHLQPARWAVSYWVRRLWHDDELTQLPNPHFLGMLDHAELSYLKPLTCDTSIPIKLGMMHMSFKDWYHEGAPHIHTKDLGHQGDAFFRARMTDKQIQIAKDNIKYLKRRVNHVWED